MSRRWWSVLLILFLQNAGCGDDDKAPDRNTDDNPSDDTSDSTGTTDDSTDTAANGTETDAETIEEILAGIDCETDGEDPVKCAYEWCRKRLAYNETVSACDIQMTDTCAIDLACYEAYFTCMLEACPLGTPVPEGDAKTPLYDCDNDFSDCTFGEV